MARTPKKPEFSEERQCGHCGNRAPMKIVAFYRQKKDYGDEETGMIWVEGYDFELLECNACGKIELRSRAWSDMTDEIEYKTLYPISSRMPPGLPKIVQKEYEAALKVRNISANAYGVLMRRVLEIVCEDRGAKGHSLHDKLGDLASKGEIPAKLVAVAHSLKNLGNVGAHAVLGGLTQAESPILEDLTRAILEYVYSAPYLADQAEKRLKHLKQSKKNPPKK